MSELSVYGIPNCDKVKKALKFFKEKNIDVKFINFKKSPPTEIFLMNCHKQLKDFPINPKGPTFRKLKQAYELASQNEKVQLLIENSSAIKRPIIMKQNKVVMLGFDEQQYLELF